MRAGERLRIQAEERRKAADQKANDIFLTVEQRVYLRNRGTREDPRYLGCLPFDKKIRKFRVKIKWYRQFPENAFGNYGVASKVLLFFRMERTAGIFRTI